jgi:hypothetical protein
MGLIVGRRLAVNLSLMIFYLLLGFEGGPRMRMRGACLPVNVSRWTGSLCWCQSTAGVHLSGWFRRPSLQTQQRGGDGLPWLRSWN